MGTFAKKHLQYAAQPLCKGSSLIVLGHLDVTELMEQAAQLTNTDNEGRRALCTGRKTRQGCFSRHLQDYSGRQNPYCYRRRTQQCLRNIKGAALAKGKPVSAINYDSRARLRMLEGRHSGNGFSYAFEEGF
jgi:formiminoglutamase